MFSQIISSLKTLLSHKLRSFLTILGIIFGVAAVISMMSIGEGARVEILQQIRLMGIRNIFIVDDRIKRKQTVGKKSVISKGLSKGDIDSIRELVPVIEKMTMVKTVEVLTERTGRSEESRVIGVSPDYFDLLNLEVKKGREFHGLDYIRDARICIIGQGIKSEFFKLVNPINKKIQLNKKPYTVVGILGHKQMGGSGKSTRNIVDSFNSSIFVPYKSLIIKNNISKNQSVIDKVILSIKDEKMIEKIALLLTRIIRRRHYYIEDFEVVIPKQLLKQQQETQKVFNIVMVSIAGISLLVGGIGIMNIMLANVLERTREIGLRRALGATMMNIRNQFLLESIILTVFGGIVGICLGYLLTFFISYYAEWNTSISGVSIMLSFGISTMVGILFGYYPAVQASRLNPIEALRHE